MARRMDSTGREGATEEVDAASNGTAASTGRPAASSSSQPAGTRGGTPEDGRGPILIASNGSAIAALVVGMSAATYAFFAVSAAAAVIAGITAIILGIRGLGIAKRYGGLHKGLAVSGVVTGALGLLLGLAVIAGGLTLFQSLDERDLPEGIQRPLDQATR